jgi:DNA-directed RNA polymerase beta' subunit
LIDINDFDAIRIGLASSKQIRDWSSGEVTKPETITAASTSASATRASSASAAASR